MDLLTRSLLNSAGVVVLGAALTFVAARYWYLRSVATKTADELASNNALLMARVAELELRTSLVQQAVLPISAAFQAILIKELTHFHTPVMDELLAKLGPPVTLSAAEEKELLTALREREVEVDDAISDSERDAARMLPMVMKRVRIETELSDNVALQIVSVPAEAITAETETEAEGGKE